VDDVTHVVNYECPEDDKAYLHRTGRTGRAGRTGIAVTFVDWRDMRRWKLIDESLGLGYPEPPETYSTSPELFSALRIPENVTGTLPAGQRARAGLGAEAIEDIGETGRTRSPRDKAGSGRGSGRPGHGRPGDGKAAQGSSGQGRADQGRADQGRAGQAHGSEGTGRSGGSRRSRTRRRTRRGEDVSRGQQQAR
jgi:superfamily II DNA/RNA helicase